MALTRKELSEACTRCQDLIDAAERLHTALCDSMAALEEGDDEVDEDETVSAWEECEGAVLDLGEALGIRGEGESDE